MCFCLPFLPHEKALLGQVRWLVDKSILCTNALKGEN